MGIRGYCLSGTVRGTLGGGLMGLRVGLESLFRSKTERVDI